MLKRIRLLLLAPFLVWASCTSQKELVYLQGDPAVLLDTTAFQMRLYPGDIISVDLYTVNPEAFPGLGLLARETGVNTDNRSAYEKGFVMDASGSLSLPYIGQVNLSGKTIPEATQLIRERFTRFIDDPVIVVKKLSFKVSLIGEFNKPGLYYVPNETLSLLEALAMAGDLNNFADRTKIKLYRKTEKGTLEIPIDITQVTAMTGPTRFVYPDDVIYAPPSPKKAFTAISPATAVITSLISTTVLVLALIINNN